MNGDTGSSLTVTMLLLISCSTTHVFVIGFQAHLVYMSIARCSYGLSSMSDSTLARSRIIGSRAIGSIFSTTM